VPVIRHNPRYSHVERRAADHSANIGSKGRRVFRGAEDLRLIRGHLFRRVAQGRNAGKIAATRGLATEVCQTSITFGHAWPISPGRRMAALDQTWQPQATSRNGCFRLEFRMPGWRERWTRSEGAAGYERQHATGSSRALIYSGGSTNEEDCPLRDLAEGLGSLPSWVETPPL